MGALDLSGLPANALLIVDSAPIIYVLEKRELAARLRVARTSVISAYEQLLAEGYIAGKARSGTFIASDLPMPSERRPLDGIPRTSGKAPRVSVRAKALAGLRAFVAESDATPFNMGRTRVDPRTVAAWRRVTHRAVRSLDAVHLGYSDPRGLPELPLANRPLRSRARDENRSGASD